MKPILTFTIAIFLVVSSAFCLEQSKVESFQEAVATAMKAKDMEAFAKLIYTEGASQYQIDQMIGSFEINLKDAVFDKVEMQPLDDPELNPKAVKWMTEGQTMNGHLYVPNLKPVIFCSIKFKSENGSSGTTGTVGIDPQGNLKFSLQRLAEQGAAANP